MCLAVPLRIVEIRDKEGICELDGLRRKIRLDFLPRAEIGDYVIAHAGFAIERLDPRQAEENLQAIREVADAAGK